MTVGDGSIGPLDSAASAGPTLSDRRGAVWIVAAAALATAGVVLLYRQSLERSTTIPGLRCAGIDVGNVPLAAIDDAVARVAQAYLKDPLHLSFQGETVKATRGQAGFVVDTEALRDTLVEVGRSGHPLSDLMARLQARRGRSPVAMPAHLDRDRALEFLSDVKDRIDRAPLDAKLDLEHHTITPEQEGYLVQVYESLTNLEYMAEHDAEEATLQAVVTEPNVSRKDLADIDISTVMASWQTAYSMAAVDSDRTYNLKVGASKVDGTVIRPHQVFSFNQVTGDRTEKEGYRVAPVIQAGELIDGLAGGMCQIASTLHAASWFAGLDVVESTPHSRPSAYITMGLDSTVVYPTVDLKLRNPYDFPIVIHYRVNQGFVRAEILGKPRGKKVAFERQILEELPFETVTREDPEMPHGQQITDQEGHSGFKLKRRRLYFVKRADQPLDKPQERILSYPPTTQYIRVGTGDPKVPKKVVPPAHHIPKPEKANAKDKDKNEIYRLIR